MNIRTWADMRSSPLALVFIEVVLVLLLAVTRSAPSGRTGPVLGILISEVTYWALPYAYLGRRYSLLDDPSLYKTEALGTHRALSEQDVPTHPWWWKESGEPSRLIIRVVVLGTVPVSIAAAAFPARLMSMFAAAFPRHYPHLPVRDGDLPLLVWAACWLGSFAALFWARSTRRKTFKESVAALVERENLQPHLSERARIFREKAELVSEATGLRGEVAKLREEFEAARAKGVPQGFEVALNQILGGFETVGHDVTTNVAALMKNEAEQKDAADKRRDWGFAVGVLVAGFLLGILSHQIGLT